jgi:hypothetical protein
VSPIGRAARLILGSLGLTAAIAAVVVSQSRAQSTAPASTSAAPQAPATGQAPSTTAPGVTLEVMPDIDGLELGAKLALFVVVTNKSETPLNDVTVSVRSSAFQRIGPAVPVGVVPPFGTMHETITVEPMREAAFGPHKVPVLVEYAWSTTAGAARKSAQAVTVSLQIKRRFEEEGKSLPGGTAAFLYLLLPVVPAFLAFDVVDRLRKGEALRIPTFGTEHVVPAFLLSLLLSVSVMTAAKLNVELAYTDPRLFLLVLAASAVLGALIPGARWIHAAITRWRWAFRNGDSLEEYLRKALLGPRTPADFVWVEGAAGADTWQGLRLQQPAGALVLGARLQVNIANGANGQPLEDAWKKATTEIFEQATLKDRRGLVDMAKAGTVKLGFQERIVRAGQPLDGAVAIDGLAEFKETKTTPKPIVQPVR